MAKSLAVTPYNEAVLEIIKILNLDRTRLNSLRIEFDLDEFVMVQARFYIEEDSLGRFVTELKKYDIVERKEDGSDEETEESAGEV